MTEQPPQDPSQPPPGWYPDSGDQQLLRWWDGAGWTAQTQPMPGTSAPQPPYPGRPSYPGQQTGPVPPAGHGRKSWPARHKVLTGLIAFAALIVIGSIAAGASGGNKQAPQSAPAAAGSASAPTSASAPVSAPAPRPSSAAPAPPSPTAAPKPRAHTVATFSGSGQDNTARFTVTGTWKLDYSFDCSSFGYQGNFQVFEDGNMGQGLSVNDLAMSKTSSTYAYNDAGTHYLQVNSECSWRMKVIDEP